MEKQSTTCDGKARKFEEEIEEGAIRLREKMRPTITEKIKESSRIEQGDEPNAEQPYVAKRMK